MSKLMGIYQIINTVNGKKYIGLSREIKKRLRYHKNALNANNHPNNYLQDSWNKYGESSFVFEILELIENEVELDNRETYWIRFYKSNDGNFGYNCNEGGGTRKHSEESKRKISESHKGKIATKETREKMSISHKNRTSIKCSDEKKKKISESQKGKILSPEHIEKIKKAKRDADIKGEQTANAKINEQQAKEIYKRIQEGQRVVSISREMKISVPIIANLKRGLAWNHITGIPKKAN